MKLARPRRLIPLLLGLALPACSGHGADGIPVPPPLGTAHIARPGTPNTALAAPAGFVPTPDIITRAYPIAPGALYTAIRAVALAQPRTYPHVEYPDRLQMHFVVRSRIMNFPDLVTVQVQPDSTLVLWSRSIYGESDLGVNKARLTRWLATLDATLAAP